MKREPLNYVAFWLITLANFKPFLIYFRKFHMLLSLPEVTSMSSNLLFVCFYWNSLIQKDVWVMTSSEWELYVSAKLLTNFKHLKRVRTFLLILLKVPKDYIFKSICWWYWFIFYHVDVSMILSIIEQIISLLQP